MIEKIYPARHIDELGRIVLPIELRKQFKINEWEKLDIVTKDNQIILRKSAVEYILLQ
jgi:transcriptional pleiotropic regulator of transition state genes